MTEPPDPSRPQNTGGWGPGQGRSGEREERIRRRKELTKRATGRDPEHPVAGSQAWARKEGLMSLSESAHLLRQIGIDMSVSGAAQAASNRLGEIVFPNLGDGVTNVIAEAQQTLGSTVAEAVNAAGSGTQSATDINATGEAVKQAFFEAQNAALAAKAKIDEAASLIAEAQAKADAAVGADRRFRALCTETGERVI